MPSLISDSILEKVDLDGKKLIGSFQDPWTMLMSILSDPRAGEVVFVVDALDEFDDVDRIQFVERITDFYL